MMKRLLLSLLFISSLTTYAQLVDEAIYGDDDRVYIEDYNSKAIQELSKSVGAIIHQNRIEEEGKNVKIWGERLVDSHYVCEDERFSKDFTTVKCTGFLVGPDLFLTAGHCIKGPTDCENKRILFEFKKSLLKEINEENVIFPKANIYKCDEIIHREYDYETQNDYALIRLNEVVTNRTPLKFRKGKKIKDDQNLFVIGHPSGLAQMISVGKVLDNQNPYFFKTNLDTFSGNSGGPVFNAQTLEVEGVLVRGEQDYVMDEDIECDRPRICEENGGDCMGEEVVRVTNIPELVPGFELPTPSTPRIDPIETPVNPSNDDDDEDELDWDDFFGEPF
ncbi:MAG: trypsin-like serine peptidase [Bacteriovoracaceae bacterium]